MSRSSINSPSVPQILGIPEESGFHRNSPYSYQSAGLPEFKNYLGVQLPSGMAERALAFAPPSDRPILNCTVRGQTRSKRHGQEAEVR